MLAAGSSLPELPRPSERVDRYRVLAEIAHGGMAAVYAVRLDDADVDKVLAMKVLLPHLAADEHFVDMFLDEARIAAQIAHPNVVQMFEVGSARGRPFMVMEYLRGRSLAQLLRHGWEVEAPVLPLAVVLFILADTAEGLHAAHEARNIEGEPLDVVHRDVSPQNVHVGYDGHVKVVDFGIAAAAGRITSTKTGEVKGKLEFMAPEQLHRRTQVDRRTDVWALGVMLWQILTRQKLFRGDTDADTMFNVLNKDTPDVQSLAPDVPDELADCLMACLSRDPKKRPHDAATVGRALRAATRDAGGCEREDVAAFMELCFTASRAVEEERLAAALRSKPPGPLHETESSDGRVKLLVDGERQMPSAVDKSRGRAGRSRVLWLAVVVLFLGIGGAAVGWLADDEPSLETPPIEASTPPAPAALPTAPAPERQTIELAVDPAVRLVLVDGRLREERPVRILLADDERAEIVLVGPDGEESVTVGVDDDGRRLGISGTETAIPPRTPRRATTMATRMTSPPATPSMDRVDGRGTGLLDVDL